MFRNIITFLLVLFRDYRHSTWIWENRLELSRGVKAPSAESNFCSLGLERKCHHQKVKVCKVSKSRPSLPFNRKHDRFCAFWWCAAVEKNWNEKIDFRVIQPLWCVLSVGKVQRDSENQRSEDRSCEPQRPYCWNVECGKFAKVLEQTALAFRRLVARGCGRKEGVRACVCVTNK